jgi:hypothetical protein
MKEIVQKCGNDMDQYVVSCKACYGIVNSQVVIAKIHVNVQNSSIHHKFVRLHKFVQILCESNFHRLYKNCMNFMLWLI